MALPVSRVAGKAGDFDPIISYLFTEWKCNLDCHYCWANDKCCFKKLSCRGGAPNLYPLPTIGREYVLVTCQGICQSVSGLVQVDRR